MRSRRSLLVSQRGRKVIHDVGIDDGLEVFKPAVIQEAQDIYLYKASNTINSGHNQT